MARRRKDPEGPPGAPPWITTFSDMMSLLLTFFIMLVALSSLDNKKVKEALSSLHGAFGVMDTNHFSPRDRPISTMQLALQSNKRQPEGQLTKIQMEGVAHALIEEIDQTEARKAVDVEMLKDGLHLRLRSDVLFSAGSANLSPAGKKLLKLLGKQLEPYSNQIEVQGHTDNTPPGKNSIYPSNWHLSFARAFAVMQYYVVEMGIERSRFELTAMADTEPIASNATAAGRAKNRRVELVLKAEPQDLKMYQNPIFKPLLPMGDIKVEPYPY